MQIFCENDFCIYQKHGMCILEKVELDIQGRCTECIYINIDENDLNDIKEKHLRNLEEWIE